MPALDDVIAAIDRIRPALTERGVLRIGVFGSVARGEQSTGSDVDILVELTDESDLFDLAAIRRMLSKAMDCDVDVVSERGLKPDIRAAVLRDVHYAA